MAGDDGYNLTRSLRFRASASAYLSRTPATNSGSQTFTFRTLVKRGTLGGTEQFVYFAGTNSPSGTLVTGISFSNDSLRLFSGVFGSTTDIDLITSQVFRDPAGFYDIQVVVDTTQATSTNRVKMYVNGVQVTSFSSTTYPALNYTLAINNTYVQNIGRRQNDGYFDGYLTETIMVSGQALTPSSFGSTNSTTGVWQPAKYTGSYGTNGFYLPFTDNSALTTSSNVGLGKDFSGNGNYWTTNNISITAGVTYDSMTDVPTLTSATAANFAVLNPLACPIPASSYLFNANSYLYYSSTSLWISAGGTIGVPSGKYYWEITAANLASPSDMMIGIAPMSVVSTFITANYFAGQGASDYGYYSANGNKYNNGAGAAYGATYANNDVIGVALDMTAGTLTFYKNNVSQGVAFTGITGTYTPCVSSKGGVVYTNFGQRPFSYTPPSGFVALNTYNLPAGSVTTSGSFTGNASADGPSVYLNGVPTAMTINGNAVTFATHVDKTAYGFKLRTSSSSYNASGTNTYSVSTVGAVLKYANAQGNP